jgi:hypothetical protein
LTTSSPDVLVGSVGHGARWSSLDGATEQLFDEVLARLAAITDMVPASQLPSVTRRSVVEASARTVSSLRSDAASVLADQLIRSLWPTSTCPDPGHAWWSTPLGELLARASHR